MKRLYRRQRRHYVFAAGVAFVGLLNLLFYLILFRPAQSDYDRLRSSLGSLRSDLAARIETVGRLQKVSEQLEISSRDRRQLYADRFIPLEEGFALILKDLDSLAQKNGVLKRRVDYEAQGIPQFGLVSVKIRMPVQGGYPNIVKLISELQSSPTFLLINSIDVTSGEDINVPLALSLNLETFLYR